MLLPPLFAADDSNSVWGAAALASLLTAAGGLILQYFTTRHTQNIQREDRSLTECWKVADQHKARADAKEAELKVAHQEASAARERVAFLEALLEANDIKIPRRRPPDGGVSDSDFHRPYRDRHPEGHDDA